MALILVVDDEAAIVETLAEVLLWKGHEVVTASNGELALAAMRQRAPQLVLLDYMMPVRDGLQTLEDMRADPSLAAIPVVLMSAASELAVPGTRRWDAFLHKPFRQPGLDEVLAKLLP